MALEKDFDLLDGYIRNTLSADDKAAFEQKLQADPSLKREYNLQQKIAEGIRKARVAELKSMLNNVPIPSSYGTEISVGAKTLIGLVAAGLVATGIYFYLDQKEETTAAEQQPITKTEQPVEVQKEIEQPTPEPETNSTPSTAVPEPEKPKEQPSVVVEKEQPAVKETTSVSKPVVVAPKQKDSLSKPEINVFDPSEETETKAAENKTATESTPKSAKSSLMVKTDSKNKKYNFHYQFKNGELYLYGPFDKKLIEIMEFFSENKHTVFLFHENKYYLLNEANEKVKPLAAISDPALIKKLKEHRGN
jgi:hypothetical protein